MIEGRPSWTAERVALRRAAHQLLDHPPVFVDPLAIPILGAAQAAALCADPRHFEPDRIDSYLRAFLVARSRVAEDAVAKAVAAGVRQYVVLGAGLDTFAYRNPHAGLHVFEADHPATQAWKRQRLMEAGIVVPKNVAFAGLDFATESLPEALGAVGWRRDEPTFFSWLGVTPYLEPAMALATLATLFPFTFGGGGVVFDYGVPLASLPRLQREAIETMAARVAAAGEPFRGFFDPADLVAKVRGIGFRQVHDLTPDELNATFFANRADRLRVGSAAHILLAWG